MKYPFWVWMAGTIAFYAAGIYFITHVNDFLTRPDLANHRAVAQYLASKMIIVSLFFAGMVWCGKLFRDAWEKRNAEPSIQTPAEMPSVK